TVPRWLNDLGGIAHEGFPALFERYCDRVAQALGDRIAYACTLNEPQGLGSSGWLLGINPPGHTDDRDGAQRAVDNLLEAHRLGAAAIQALWLVERARIGDAVAKRLRDPVAVALEKGGEPLVRDSAQIVQPPR